MDGSVLYPGPGHVPGGGCRSMDGSVLYPGPGHVPGGGGVDPWMVPSSTPTLDTYLGVGV